MKKVFAWVSVVALLAVSSPLIAGDNEKGGHDWSEKRVQMLQKKLNLTADQVKSVKAILDEKRDKMKSAQDDTDAKINAVLNDEQKKKFEEMKGKRAEKMKERKENRQEHKKGMMDKMQSK